MLPTTSASAAIACRAELIRAIGLIKWAAAETNGELGELPAPLAAAIADAALEIAAGRHAEQFPLGVYQTGSGTSTNMNVNEVIAHLASRGLGKAVHANDHVNRCQSSNDVIPTAIHVAAALAVRDRLLPALRGLAARHRGEGGRSRRPGEARAYASHGRAAHHRGPGDDRVEVAGRGRDCAHRGGPHAAASARARRARPSARASTRTRSLPTGAIARLGARTGLPFTGAPDRFASLAAQDTAVELSGTLRGAAVVLLKIANDLRWMNSGPLAGLAEIALPALQPGSSIMPGKVNPVIPEAVAMAATAVMARDASVGMAGASGNFQLNVMLPLIADAVLESIGLLADSSAALAERVIPGITVNSSRISESLARNPMLLTALAPRIGYDRAAAIAKRACRGVATDPRHRGRGKRPPAR